MAFSDFKSVLEVAQKYNLKTGNRRFLESNLSLSLPQYFWDDLEYSLNTKKPNPSEIALSENFISPIIRYVARRHPHLIFWSREYDLNVDEVLCGKPDYLFSYNPEPQFFTLGNPLVCVAEAKVEKFGEAWGQNLAEMVACQKLNPEITIYGWTTNGDIWQFGKLEGNIFIQDSRSYSLTTQAEQIAGILDWIFADAVRQAENYLNK